MHHNQMSNGKLIAARVASLIVTVAFWLWTGAKAVVTFIGATTVADDYNQLIQRLPEYSKWLLSTPWWVPASLAAILTIFLLLLSGPHKFNTDPYATAATQKALPTKNEIGKFRFVQQSDHHALKIGNEFIAASRLTHVIISGKYFIARHHLSGVHWTPSKRIRIAEFQKMARGEEFQHGIIHQQADANSVLSAQISLFGRRVEWPSPPSDYEHILVEVSVSSDEGSASWRKLIQLRNVAGKNLTDFIDLDQFMGETFNYEALA